MTLCHECGAETAENDLACSQCGASLEAPVIGDVAELSLEAVPETPVEQEPEANEIVAAESAPAEEKIITNDFADDEPNATNGGETSNAIAADTAQKRPGLKTLAEGTVLNARYQIVRKIGGGGMGAVYLALDKNLNGVERAVKEMVHTSIEEDQQKKAIEDFRRESMILSTLDHPSIPTIYDYFFDEGESRFYLVMKYISGGDLAGRLRTTPGGRIDERLVTEWAIQVTDVLAYLHGLPETIVYRDLKPSNIMLDGASGRVMLIDFGIARSIGQKQEKGVTAVGTMGYAPPELFSGNVEPRSDIYSLGSTMFHLLTGADPQNNPLLIFDFQKNPRPRQINPQLSDQMERILMRAVEYNADSRFSGADEMRYYLKDHLENLKRGSVTFGVTEIPAAVSLTNQRVFCGFCGQRIVASDMFCAFCGSKQPIAQQGVHSEIYSHSSTTAKLLIDGTGELDPPSFALEKPENLLGRRDPTANIFPDVDLSRFDPDTKISRRHARIWRDGDNYLVEDLGSSNGTIVQNAASHEPHRLQPHQPHVLANGDVLRVGDTTLSFSVN
ncbi:MAG TPA: FHA domain-containing serine/threonine-protein kinase [Pyrinomonadaceae bacterium]|nr:FHA domain-containing serine/threonine-protein kinase [Pyrinomonadaceae bacterium]